MATRDVGETQVGQRPVGVVEGAQSAGGHQEEWQQDKTGHYARDDSRSVEVGREEDQGGSGE
jgi:hypothetical protein